MAARSRVERFSSAGTGGSSLRRVRAREEVVRRMASSCINSPERLENEGRGYHMDTSSLCLQLRGTGRSRLFDERQGAGAHTLQHAARKRLKLVARPRKEVDR